MFVVRFVVSLLFCALSRMRMRLTGGVDDSGGRGLCEGRGEWFEQAKSECTTRRRTSVQSKVVLSVLADLRAVQPPQLVNTE